MRRRVISCLASDGVSLNGYINEVNSKKDKVLIQIHGMTSNCFKYREQVITETVESINVDSICFNTRGSEIAKYIKYNDGNKKIGGTAFEDVEESYFDIEGVIKYALELGYTSIYLQGHSLGSTKIVYTYNKMRENSHKFLKYIKGIILLSLVDIPDMINTYTKREFLRYAEEKENKNEGLELMPSESFIHPISVKTFLRYIKYNKNIDFAQYTQEDNEFVVLNSIEIPLFMRWGNDNEMIKRDAKELVEFMRKKIKNNRKNIDYIDGANHSYNGKENVLAEQIKGFLENN